MLSGSLNKTFISFICMFAKVSMVCNNSLRVLHVLFIGVTNRETGDTIVLSATQSY